MGVSSPGRPVTARIDSVGASAWNTVNMAAAMFTWMRSTGSSAGSQRQRSRLATICEIRSSSGTLRAARVAESTTPSSFRPKRFWARITPLARASSNVDDPSAATVESSAANRARSSSTLGESLPTFRAGPGEIGDQPPLAAMAR